MRALPPSHGRAYVQELVNHFFYNVEDRMRAVLGDRAPDRVVRSYLKEMRDQWAGVGAALDHGMVKGDAELAEVLWRNVFAAKTPAASASSSVSGVAERGKEKETVVEAPLKIKGRDAKDLEHLYTFIAFLRREAKRLEAIPDEDVLAGRIGAFGGIVAPEDSWDAAQLHSTFDAATGHSDATVQEPLRKARASA
jgi:cytochrome b pre-mRNA-processing protein 3